jgi:hypothetical protein
VSVTVPNGDHCAQFDNRNDAIKRAFEHRPSADDLAKMHAHWIHIGRPHCEKCDRDLLPGECAYRRRAYIGHGFFGGARMPMQTECRDCMGADRVVMRECACGHCQRPLFVPCDGVWRRHPFCCRSCEVAFYSARQLAKRARAPQPCPVCVQPFKGARADSKYCSSACRQKAYRHRAAAEPA